MNTPFFQFLLYILLVILTYFIVRSISKKVHEAFSNGGLPPALTINGKLVNNNLHLYYLLPEITNEANCVKVTIDNNGTRSIFYSIRDMDVVDGLYHIVVENLVYDVDTIVMLQLKSDSGLGDYSNLLKFTPKIIVEEETEIPIKSSQKYVSCHPDGTYTVNKSFIINPPLINNLSPDLLTKLQEVMKPKEKTYDVEINLE